MKCEPACQTCSKNFAPRLYYTLQLMMKKGKSFIWILTGLRCFWLLCVLRISSQIILHLDNNDEERQVIIRHLTGFLDGPYSNYLIKNTRGQNDVLIADFCIVRCSYKWKLQTAIIVKPAMKFSTNFYGDCCWYSQRKQINMAHLMMFADTCDVCFLHETVKRITSPTNAQFYVLNFHDV